MIQPWRDRLDWTGERSPDGSAIRKAMEAEIRELRAAARKADAKIGSTIRQADRKIAAANSRADRLVDEARIRADNWRAAAMKYRRTLLRNLK